MPPLSHLCIVCGAQGSGSAPGKCSIYWISWIVCKYIHKYIHILNMLNWVCFVDSQSMLENANRWEHLNKLLSSNLFWPHDLHKAPHCYLMPVSLVPAQRAQWTSCLLCRFAPHCPLQIPVPPTPAREIPAEVWASSVSSVLGVLFLILACSSSKQYQELWSVTCKLTS